MVQRFYNFIVAFCLVGYGGTVSAQVGPVKIPAVTIVASAPLIKYSIRPHRPNRVFVNQSLPPWHAYTVDDFNEKKTGQVAEVLKNRAVTASINSSFYTDNFGFFCKRELQLEKAVKIPFRFRLGSLENTNRLEGKY